MSDIPSCFNWRKDYYYFASNGSVQVKSLHWFQRVVRVLGFYENTHLASIARECLMPRMWRSQDQLKISNLIKRVKLSFPRVTWIEQFPDRTRRKISIQNDGQGLIILSSAISPSGSSHSGVNRVFLSHMASYGRNFGVYMNADSDDDYIPKVLVKMVANSKQLSLLYWKDGSRNRLSNYSDYGFMQNLQLGEDGPIFELSRTDAQTTAQAYPLVCPYSFDFFA